jgi:hypothetical protein
MMAVKRARFSITSFPSLAQSGELQHVVARRARMLLCGAVRVNATRFCKPLDQVTADERLRRSWKWPIPGAFS